MSTFRKSISIFSHLKRKSIPSTTTQLVYISYLQCFVSFEMRQYLRNELECLKKKSYFNVSHDVHRVNNIDLNSMNTKRFSIPNPQVDFSFIESE
jgi:hypothetical protein